MKKPVLSDSEKQDLVNDILNRTIDSLDKAWPFDKLSMPDIETPMKLIKWIQEN